MKKILDTKRFKPDKDFEGIDRTVDINPRDGPVQFELDRDSGLENVDKDNHEVEGEDIYGLKKYLFEAKKKEKNIKKLEIMHTVGGSGVGSEMSQRRNVDFVKQDRTSKKNKSSKKSPKRKRSPSPRRSSRNYPTTKRSR